MQRHAKLQVSVPRQAGLFMKGRDEEEPGFRVAWSAIATELGTVQIVPQPSGLDAPWQIDGPGGFQAAGQGEAELTDRVPGSYTVTWDEVSGWVEPESETKDLEPGGVVAFVGVYTQAPPPMGFVYVPPGTFQMGSPADEPGRGADETRHAVTLTKGFFVSQYMVTEEWWCEVMGGTPTTSQLPMEGLSWDVAVAFCNELSLLEGLTPAYTIHGPNGNAMGSRRPVGQKAAKAW